MASNASCGFLATVGSVSPFVGLFGTVWSTMKAFETIAARHDTTLAGGGARHCREAPFATAMGLVAAVAGGDFLQRLYQ